jgi:hypothetical protein
MNVASITAIATSQGLPPLEAGPLLAGGGVIYFCPSFTPESIYRCAGKAGGFNVVGESVLTSGFRND